jgi:hypothetical protein
MHAPVTRPYFRYVHENGTHELNPSNVRQRLSPKDLLITIAEHP